jgi:hypothetical protein
VADGAEAERIEAELSARSIEWWLDKNTDPGALADDEFLAPTGASRAIEFMESRCDWLRPLAEVLTEAAAAEAAFETARDAGASVTMVTNLRSIADEARRAIAVAAYGGQDAAEAVRAYGRFQHAAAALPAEIHP